MNEPKQTGAVTLNEINNGKILEIHLTGKLAKADYESFLPAIERLLQIHPKLRLLVVMHDFHGWTPGGLWQDIKFDANHFRDIDRIAMLGETSWQHGMALVCKPFTSAEVRYFNHAAADQALHWLQA